MDFFTKKQISKEEIKNYYFHFIVYNIKDNTLSIKLNRPEKKNALHPQMINEIGVLLEYAKYSKYVRIIIFESTGDTFCAGLDLKVINSKIDKIKSTVPSPKSEIIITDLLKNSAKPIISKVTGNVYAGGLLLIANSTYVIAIDNLKFSLPEVKRGLFPFQVMESLIQVLPPKKALSWCIRGNTISSKEAKKIGLITEIHDIDVIDEKVEDLKNEILENAPKAINMGIKAFNYISNQNKNQKYLQKMLKELIKTKDANEGIKAFIEKRKPNWENN